MADIERLTEQVRKAIDELKVALHDRAVVAHAEAKRLGSIEHKGSFDNCPSPECVEVRRLLEKDARS